MNILSRQKLSAVEWDTLVNNSPDGWVFSLWGWQELIKGVESWGLEDYSFAICEGRRLLALVPLQYHPGSGRMASSGWGGSGPIIDGRFKERLRNKLMGQAIRYSIELARQRGATSFDISLPPVTTTSTSNLWGVNPLVFHGLEDSSMLTQVIDLSKTEEELWAELTSDARRQIRQARKEGLFVKRVDWAQHLDCYYELHIATYRRTGVQPHPLEYFAGIAANVAPSGHSVLWAVYTKSGDVMAYHNAAWFGLGAYYHTGCSTDVVVSPGASYLLFWVALIGAKDAGIRWYDCGTIFPGKLGSEKQKGLSTFKTKFGGQAHRQFSGGLTFKSNVATTAPTFPQRLVKSFLSCLGATGPNG